MTIGVEEVQRSFELLSDLLRRPNEHAVLLRAELLLRAKVALSDLDYVGALTNAWTASEGMLGDLLSTYLDENENREGIAAKFVNKGRRDFLVGSADVTVRHKMEVLSLLDRLPFPLYAGLRRCSKARNGWLHSETEPSGEVSILALRTAGELFELLEDIPLHVIGLPPV
jgi:hypothetical protein